MVRGIPRKCAGTPCAVALRKLLLTVLLVTGCLVATGARGDGEGVDAVLLMDSSGSMAKNDPGKLRVQAARLFMSLLDAEDRIGLVSFSDNAYPVLPLTPVEPANRSRVLAATDRISSRGVYTNLHAALAGGMDMLESQGREGSDRVLLLMSDGKMDVGDTAEDSALLEKLESGLLQRARRENIRIHTIAFTEASDTRLLNKLARSTDGLYRLARSDRDLHPVFATIFETAKQPDMLPIEGGGFDVDASVREVTIVASKEDSDVRVYLKSPGGEKFNSDSSSSTLKWFTSEYFDMITLQEPQAGRWKLMYTGGANRAYVVTDMALAHNEMSPNLQVNQDMLLEVWLEEDGKRLDREAVLTGTRFELEIIAPDGASARFDLVDTGKYGDRKAADGVYSNTLGYEIPGTYQINLLAQAETFSRQKSVHFDVAAAAAGADAPPVESAQTAPEKSPSDSIQPPVVDKPAPQDETQEKPTEAAGTDEADDEGMQVDAAETEQATPAPKKKRISMVLALSIFLAINLLLGLLAAAIWWVLKKPSGTVTTEVEEEETRKAA